MQPGDELNHYEFLELLGEGGMAQVWKARNKPLDRFVAIKFLKPEFDNDADMQARFLNEARRHFDLNHQHIVKFSDFFQSGGRNFLVMQYVEGGTLEKHLADNSGPMTAEVIGPIALKILAAIDYAHNLVPPVVHRDIKPSNILLGANLHPHLADFGIAVAIGQRRITRQGETIGTPEYMSPEQILYPHLVGGRSDLYSLGVVLYEMLTGKLPFDASGPGSDVLIRLRQAKSEPRPPRELNPKISPRMEAVVLKALKKDLDQRYQTAASMADDLRIAIKGGRFSSTAIGALVCTAVLLIAGAVLQPWRAAAPVAPAPVVTPVPVITPLVTPKPNPPEPPPVVAKRPSVTLLFDNDSVVAEVVAHQFEKDVLDNVPGIDLHFLPAAENLKPMIRKATTVAWKAKQYRKTADQVARQLKCRSREFTSAESDSFPSADILAIIGYRQTH